MSLNDLDQIGRNLEADFDDFWNYNILKNEIQNPNSFCFVLKENNEIIGFSGITVLLDEADITNIVVKKDHRGSGFSKILMQHLINFCKEKNISKINLEVSSSNNVAIGLYKSLGFVQVGCRKNYYKKSDGLLFSLFLIK